MNYKNIVILENEFRIYGEGKYYEDVGGHSIQHIVAAMNKIDEINNVFDIGANIGVTSLAFSLKADSVYAFEPNPSTLKQLESTISFNRISNVHTYGLAIGESTGAILLRDVPAFASGNFIVLPESEGAKFLPLVEVECISLDAFIISHGIKNVDMIKIDVEGFEIDVLEGAARTISRDNPIVLLEFNSYCLSAQREINPLEALRIIRGKFNNISVYDRDIKNFEKLNTDKDYINFLRNNFTKYNVDDLLCFNE